MQITPHSKPLAGIFFKLFKMIPNSTQCSLYQRNRSKSIFNFLPRKQTLLMEIKKLLYFSLLIASLRILLVILLRSSPSSHEKQKSVTLGLVPWEEANLPDRGESCLISSVCCPTLIRPLLKPCHQDRSLDDTSLWHDRWQGSVHCYRVICPLWRLLLYNESPMYEWVPFQESVCKSNLFVTPTKLA